MPKTHVLAVPGSPRALKKSARVPSGELAPDAPMLEAVRAVDAFLGIRSHLDCSSTDANIPLALGLQAASIGAGGQGAGLTPPKNGICLMGAI